MSGIKDIDAVPKGFPQPPFLMMDVSSYSGEKILVLERSVGAWRGIRFSIPYGYIVDDVMLDINCAPKATHGVRYYPWAHNEVGAADSFKDHCKAKRATALSNGASPEAIRLIHGYIQPFTKKEVATMAEKLKTKAAPGAKKGAAKAEKAPKENKGNTEALAKAREAADGKRAEARARKVKLLVDPKDSGLRGGRLAKLQAIKTEKPKTLGDILGKTVVDDAGKEHTIDMGAINGMLSRGHIELTA